ncbi:MAG: hypothetical protein ACP5D9_03480 [Mariniphaga sp.]
MGKQDKRQKTGLQPQSSGVLKWIELPGNKLPHPFWLFVWFWLDLPIGVGERIFV